MTTLTASGKKVGRPAKTYDTEQITTALVTMIACAGNATEAHKRLKSENGSGSPSAATLKQWVTETHAARYRELERVYGHEIEAVAVDAARRNILLASELEQAGLEAALHDVEAARTAGDRYKAGELEYSEYQAILRRAENPAQMAVSASKVKAANVDQVLKFTGRPTEIHENRNADDILDKLMKGMGLLAEDTTAITDAEVVENP